MDKMIVSVGSGLAIAASLWIAQSSSFLSGLSRFHPLHPQDIPEQVILVQSDLIPSIQTMTTDRLGEILSETVETLEGEAGQWQFEHNDVSMVVVTSDEYDRMRLVAPIASLSSLTNEQRDKMLFANFHTTLDARYAIGTLGGQPAVVSVFVHPLSSLSDDHFRSALDQVSQAALTFGTTYSSGELLLSPGGVANPIPEAGDEVGI